MPVNLLAHVKEGHAVSDSFDGAAKTCRKRLHLRHAEINARLSIAKAGQAPQRHAGDRV